MHEIDFLPYHLFLEKFVREHKPSVIVETGTLFGLSAMAMRRGNPEALIYTIDIDDKSGSQITDKSIIQLKGDSKDMVGKVPKEIELLFIDGDHTFEGALSDYTLYAPLVKKGGHILIDDILESEGVNKFWKFLGNGEVLEGVHESHGMGLIKV